MLVISLDRKLKKESYDHCAHPRRLSNLIFHILFHLLYPFVVEASRWGVGSRGRAVRFSNAHNRDCCCWTAFCFLTWSPHHLFHAQGQQSSILSARLLTGLTHWQQELSSFHLLAVDLGHERGGEWAPVQRGASRLPLIEPLQMRVAALPYQVYPKPHTLPLPLGEQTPVLNGYHGTAHRGQVGSAHRKWQKSLLFCLSGEELARFPHHTAHPLAGLSAPVGPIWAPPSTLPSTPFSEPNPWFGEHGRFP